MENALINIAYLAADCFTPNNRRPTNRCTTNLVHIGQIASQELSGNIRKDICDTLLQNYCGVVIAEKILRICHR